jgi:hypothetical protein
MVLQTEIVAGENSEGLDNSYVPPNIIRTIMLRRGPWAGHVARKEECYMHIKLGCNA